MSHANYNTNAQEYNHPAYVNIPFFVLQEERLDFFNKFLFSLFWSFSVSGKRINTSNGYLAELFKVSEKYIQIRIKDLEDLGFIRRYSRKYKRYIEVLHAPFNDIEISNSPNIELVPTTVGVSTNIILPPTTVGVSHQLQLVPPPTTVGPYNKEDNKEDNKANTTPIGVSEGKSFLLTVKDMLKDNPHNIDEPLLNEWMIIRKNKKAPLTRTAWNRTNKVMTRLVEAGLLAVDCFERMVASGWQGMEFKYFEQELIKNPVLKYPTPSERAINEQKIRERELKSNQEKQKEIEESTSSYKNIKQHINIFDMKKHQDADMEKLGMSRLQYHDYITMGKSIVHK